MTTQKSETASQGAGGDRPPAGPPEEVVDRLAGLLPEEELERALEGPSRQVTGPGGLVSQLARRVIETALGAELPEHLGYPPGQAPPSGAGNTRNGSTPKTLRTELGPVEIKAPRDRKGSFVFAQLGVEPLTQLVLPPVAPPASRRCTRARDHSRRI